MYKTLNPPEEERTIAELLAACCAHCERFSAIDIALNDNGARAAGLSGGIQWPAWRCQLHMTVDSALADDQRTSVRATLSSDPNSILVGH